MSVRRRAGKAPARKRRNLSANARQRRALSTNARRMADVMRNRGFSPEDIVKEDPRRRRDTPSKNPRLPKGPRNAPERLRQSLT